MIYCKAEFLNLFCLAEPCELFQYLAAPSDAIKIDLKVKKGITAGNPDTISRHLGWLPLISSIN